MCTLRLLFDLFAIVTNFAVKLTKYIRVRLCDRWPFHLAMLTSPNQECHILVPRASVSFGHEELWGREPRTAVAWYAYRFWSNRAVMCRAVIAWKCIIIPRNDAYELYYWITTQAKSQKPIFPWLHFFVSPSGNFICFSRWRLVGGWVCLSSWSYLHPVQGD